MKRVALLCVGLAVGAASAAEAQLTMQMSNGWSFTFSGNVNAFAIYESQDEEGGIIPGAAPGGLVGIGGKGFNIRTGLLPAFAVFDAKGKEGNTDLGVHFGFAPQIQCGPLNSVGGNLHDCFTDQTLFGVGATGGQIAQGTTLGRIGFGYIYPQFKAQMTFSTPAGRPFQLSVGLFDPASNPPYNTVELPRVEAEGVWSQGTTKFWVGGLFQNNSTGGAADESGTAWGGSGGVRFGGASF